MTGSLARPAPPRVAGARVTVLDLSDRIALEATVVQDDAFAVEWQLEAADGIGRRPLAPAGGGGSRPRSD